MVNCFLYMEMFFDLVLMSVVIMSYIVAELKLHQLQPEPKIDYHELQSVCSCCSVSDISCWCARTPDHLC